MFVLLGNYRGKWGMGTHHYHIPMSPDSFLDSDGALDHSAVSYRHFYLSKVMFQQEINGTMASKEINLAQ